MRSDVTEPSGVELVSAGYFLARPCPRPAWVHGGGSLLPEVLLTLSTCLTDVVPSLWPSERGAARPEEAARVVGYEILGDGASEDHSIVCTGSEVGVHATLGIGFNGHGLIDALPDARRAAEWMSEDGRGEPVPYFPWRLALYDRGPHGDRA